MPPIPEEILRPSGATLSASYSRLSEINGDALLAPERPPFSWGKFWSFVGPGWLMSMAYLDPGNLEADLQSGAYSRYELLYVTFWSTVLGGLYQVLAARLGSCTGRHLAELCRAEYPRLVTYAVWIMMELVIIGCDIQEVLGTAIALQILFGLPLWIGCLITALDTFTFLAIDRRGDNKSNRLLETFFMGLIGIMCACFFVDFTVTLVQSRSRRGAGADPVKEANFYFGLEAILALFVSFLINMFVISAFASTFYSQQCDQLGADPSSDVYSAGIQTACIPAAAALVSGNDIYSASTGLTCAIENGAVAASCAQCFTTEHTGGYCQQVGLKEAGAAVSSSLGHYAKIIWAVGLVASGQASTMTGTYAGQFVMEGFLDLRIATWKRVAITRTMALGPALVVALLTEYDGFHSDIVSQMINVMQSVQLPFALVPLLTFTTNKRLMGQSFVYNRWITVTLIVGTLALFGVNYTLVFRTLGVLSPRNDFFVSQRAATDFELSRLDTLSLEEQEILANIQELQLQLMQLRAEQEEDSDEDSTDKPLGASATKTTGGLDKLMCLTGVRAEMNFLWVGWVGQHIPKSEHEAVRRLLLQHNCLPVFLSSDVASRHTGFSSEVLWSLFHYVSEPVPFTFNAGSSTSFHSTKRFSKQDWRAYESANESFADAIAEIYNEGDSVWVHDYHLMLLPSLLRQRIPPCRIGWFLHTPFPASDVYCRLPVRSQLLTGVLQADLVGFQTFDYERHFLSTCHRLLGVECSHKGVRSALPDRDHFTSIGVFPIGISLEPFARAASSMPTLNRVNELHDKFGGKRIILGIDRLDNIKGIPHKMLAMEMLLDRFPEWQHNVVLVQIGISSRSGVVDSKSTGANGAGENTRRPSASNASGESSSLLPRSSSYPIVGTTSSTGSDSPIKGLPESPPNATSPIAAGNIGYDPCHQLEMSSHSYHNIVTQVNQIVGRINGIFGTLDYAPIHFIQQQATPHEELCALYDLADVCLVTSTRDGMNLVSHEFIVCQQHFMRNKDERKKAARAAARGFSSSSIASEGTVPSYLGKGEGMNTGEGLTKGGVLSPISSPRQSSASVLTDWEGEDGGPGVLVVSEFAGCSQSLSGAIVVNPWNIEDVALSVHQALKEVPETWLNGVRVGVAAEDGFFYRMNLSNTREHWKTMSKFQYDVATARSGGSTATMAGVGSVSGSLDASYSSDAHSMMHMSMGSFPAYSRHISAPGSTDTGDGTPVAGSIEPTDDSFGGDDMSWKDLVLPTMLMFTDRTPGSYIEDKESSLTWHYGDADPHFGSWQAKDLQIILERQLIGTALEVYQGHMSVSVEHEGCTKTRVLEGILKHLSLPDQISKKNDQEVDFVLCVCDDVTDDQMFQTLNALVAESNERHDERKRKEEEQAENERIRRNSIALSNPVPPQLHALPVPSAAHVSKAKPRMPRPRGGNGVTDELEPAMKLKGGSRKRHQNEQLIGAAAAAVRGHEEYSTDDDDELDAGDLTDDDNKVAFSRLQKVPVRLAENVAIFAVIVGPDVQHSGGRHACSFAVDSLADVRKVLKEFVDESRKGGTGTGADASSAGGDCIASSLSPP
ncbi:HAD-like domain [Phytophthora cactorum]|nr:HAD-like domain [Phytophthora cactorum]